VMMGCVFFFGEAECFFDGKKKKKVNGLGCFCTNDVDVKDARARPVELQPVQPVVTASSYSQAGQDMGSRTRWMDFSSRSVRPYSKLRCVCSDYR